MTTIAVLCLVCCIGIFVGGAIFAQIMLREVKELRARDCQMEISITELRMLLNKEGVTTTHATTVTTSESVSESRGN